MKNIKSSSWQDYVKNISEGIKNAVISDSLSKEKQVFDNVKGAQEESLPKLSDQGVLEVCLETKSVLAMINFGDVEPSDKDKDFVKRRILSLLSYFSQETKCYNMIGGLRWEYCLSAFGDSDVFINRTMADVFLTFVYFRRAIKRKNFLGDIEDYNAVNEQVADVMKNIIQRWIDTAKSNDYRGWGFMSNSKTINLVDTYRVVEAISKFQDACDSSDETKKDDYIIKRIGEDIVTEIENVMYKVALNIYDETASCYGEGIFYKTDENEMSGKAIYRLSNSEQVLNSNRTSALFQPLYVAMITMLGYTDKEVVIRKLMTSQESANNCFNAVIAEVSKEAGREDDKKALEVIYSSLSFINEEHAPLSELSDEEWKNLYESARRLEKAFETYAKNEMSRGIKEYRDYLNKTKDAIDNIQVYYRKFSDAQKLGIVDADYAIFSNADIPNIDIIDLSRLNKSNIISSYLKPLLLSSKIMIVNALTKYPQSDMETLFNDIMDSVYRKRNGKKKGSTEERIMLWNEEEIDMFATACNCDCIAYDYFDYYSKYELNYRAMTKIFNETQDYIIDKGALDKDDIDFDLATNEISAKAGNDEKTAEIVGALIDIAKEEIKALKASYEQKLKENKKVIEKENKETLKGKDSEIAEKDMLLKKVNEEKVSLEKESEISRVIQELVNRKVKEELERMMGSIALINIKADKFNKRMLDIDDEELETYPLSLRNAIKYLKKEIDKISDEQKKKERLKELADETKEMKEMFELALDGLMDISATQSDDRDMASIVKNYIEFKEENKKFERTWFKSVIGKIGENGRKLSLSNVFSIASDEGLDILGDKETKEE